MTRHRNSPLAKGAARCKKKVASMLKGMMCMELFDQIIHLHDLEEDALDIALLLYYIEKKKVSAICQDSASKRKFRQRRSWSSFQGNLTDRQFRRYFRMSKECFQYLCNRIEHNVGGRVFKSEGFLEDLRHSDDARDKKSINMMSAHEGSTGGFISGEVKLALTLRLLAGGSYLDLSLLYEVGASHAYAIFHDVIKNWILDDRLVKINGLDYVQDEERLQNVALEFALRSDGLFSGCIGAIDGWVVKIRKPTSKDNVTNPGSFFSRKGYFGLNVVAIVDRKKRVLYRVIQSRGAEHDSTAFKNSRLYTWLAENWGWLKEKGFYFIGDSACTLKSFLLTPYDNVLHGTPEDNFNFFHSSSRTCVECAFGEVDLRWGVLWKALQFDLKHNMRIIDACIRLHNFIVDFREECGDQESDTERSLFDEDCRRFMAAQSHGCSVGVQGGEDDIRRDSNGNPSVGGRPFNAELMTTREGKSIRDSIRDYISAEERVRPPSNWYREKNRVFDS